MACEQQLATLTIAVGSLGPMATAAQVAAGAVVAKALEMQAAANVAQQSLITLVAGCNAAFAALNAYNACLLQQGGGGAGFQAQAPASCSGAAWTMESQVKDNPPTLAAVAESLAVLKRQIDSLMQGT